ncbi:MAG: hypothetical protein Q8M31_23725 [Beijerinckiaceae bacterium]|nr:hypothetical protein [Beijerinckiaceae bacterium]
MFAVTLKTAIEETRSLARLDEIARDVWRALGSGAITEEAAGFLSEAIEDRRREVRPLDTLAHRAPCVARLANSIFPMKRRRPPCPDRAASIARRRTLAASGVMPPALAARFTTGELAALKIVSDEVRARKACELTVGEIAARAGVCDRTARNAIRAAASLGLVIIVERRRKGAKNLSNVVRVVSREWLAWLAKRPALPRLSIGGKNVQATVTELHIKHRNNGNAFRLSRQNIGQAEVSQILESKSKPAFGE